jgi:hypothetical protein
MSFHYTYGPRGVLQIDDARIVFRNFSGTGSMYNREGDRNFAVVIPNQEIADELTNDGWNIKVRPGRDDDEEPFMFMTVKLSYNEYSEPEVYLVSGNSKHRLDQDEIKRLDRIKIASVDMDIRPHDWTMPNGKSGRTARLNAIWVTQDTNRFAERFAEEEYPE